MKEVCGCFNCLRASAHLQLLDPKLPVTKETNNPCTFSLSACGQHEIYKMVLFPDSVQDSEKSSAIKEKIHRI